MTIYHTLAEFLKNGATPHISQGRILGLDVGSKYIGISLSDGGQMIASPYAYYERKNIQNDILHFQKIINDFSIKFIVAGLPFNLDGSLSTQAESIMTYIEKINAGIEIPFVFWDERFSTLAVERILLEQDMSRKKRENNIDKLAATYLLQGALDFIKNYKRGGASFQ